MATEISGFDTIFCAAIAIATAADRSAYIASACGNDTGLRDRVDKLVSAHFRAGNFMEPPESGRIEARAAAAPLAEGPGTIVGSCKLLEQIGAGGFGVVFMAEQLQPVRRKVALKVLKPGMDTHHVVARFEAERQALALMDHPNIAQIFDGGATATGRPYFVMELVRGVPITEFCDQNQRTVRQRLELFVSVCHAVQHAHQKGIIHRDLKPSNVMVTLHDDRPVVKVIDFGIAKATGQQLTDKTLFTQFSQLIGTPTYMSPEQAQMSGLDVDTRSDVYSLGVLLYELLTGTTPFDQQRLRTVAYDEMRRIIREEEPARPSTRISTLGLAATTVSASRASDPKRLSQLVRGELDWIVMKALEKDRNRRYESASALAADVTRYLHDEPVMACPPSLGYRLGKSARRHRAALATAAVVALALLLALASLLAAVHGLTAQNAAIAEEHLHTRDALNSAKQANDDLQRAVAREQRTLSFQSIALAERELAANNVGRAEELLAECPHDLRGWEWHFLKRLPHDPPRVIQASKTWLLALAASADGRYFATSSFGMFYLGEVKLWEAATGREVCSVHGHIGPVSSLAFRRQDNQLATAGLDHTVVLWDPAAQKPVHKLKGHRGPVLAVTYGPDGTHLATGGHDGTVRLWEAATGAEVQRYEGHGGQVFCVAFSPDGRRLASWGLDFQVRIWDVRTDEEKPGPLPPPLARTAGRVFSLHFHRDGRHLVSAAADGLCVWDLEANEARWTVQGINSGSLCAVFSPDGDRLVCAGLDRTVKSLDWRTGQEILALRGHNDLVTAVAFSADGHRLISASLDGTVRLWNAAPLAPQTALCDRRMQAHEAQVLGLAFSPDRGVLATAASDGTTKLWDVATGRLIHALPGRSMITSVAFQSGGTVVTTVDVAGSVVQWDAATAVRRRTLQAHLGPVLNAGFNVAFSANGERFAALGKDEAVHAWETDTGRELIRVPEAIPPHLTVFMSPDGKQLAAASLGTIQLLDVASGKKVAALHGIFHLVHNLAFSSDGRRLAAAAWDGTVRVWDSASGKPLHTFRHGDRATCVAFHPGGRQLASGSCDNTAKVWDLQTGLEVATLRGHIGYVMAVAYSPDGTLLATASGHRYQGEVQLWKTADFGKAMN
jgi:eukaryotic-like serine/threonine-protein kinase